MFFRYYDYNTLYRFPKCICIDVMLHEYADEPAASRKGGKHFARGRADEGGDVRQGPAVPSVHLAQVEVFGFPVR